MSEKALDDKLWDILRFISEQIRFSDYKAVAVLGINTLVWGFIVTNFIGIYSSLEYGNLVNCIIILSFLLTNFISLLLAILSILPILNTKPQDSVLYFGHISARKRISSKDGELDARHKYETDLISVLKNEEGMHREIVNQIWINSDIAYKKFVRVSLCIKFLLVSLILAVISVTLNLYK